jgi:putative DNA primase/helicase
VKLKSEASGILNWALEGLSDYLVNGLDEPECVTKATTEYRDNQDWLERFVREECEMDIKEFIGARKLYDRFCQWADRTGEYCVKEVKFAEAMTTHGYQKARPTVGGKRLSGVAYMGMKLKDSFGDMGMGMNTLQNVDEL